MSPYRVAPAIEPPHEVDAPPPAPAAPRDRTRCPICDAPWGMAELACLGCGLTDMAIIAAGGPS